ncbi:hypothetical protein Nepgr_028480 [Nepenthes gracilis]|uniref:Phosphatidic acid phosphatase type 2/haloperoxidase domain-containing protein n=1 Tax=Nepenthes gracilis TaxID=150966 RepID=A0AAD3Y260_NEPGR|nr:hypothetical protein Nepgr_028480 [Nepenthes gracilis]
MAAETPPPPPPPSRSIIGHLVDLDTAWSLRLHTIAAPIIPHAALKLLELSGDGRFWFPVSISLFLSPLSLHSLHLYRTFLCLLLGSLLDLVLIGLIKHLIRRPRPVYNKGMHLTLSVDHWSFPSGHSSRVCFIAAFFYLSISEIVEGIEQLKLRKGEFVERWIGDCDTGKVVNVFVLAVWIWSMFTSASRVLLGRHFVFDIVVGACLGVIEALFVYHFFKF